MNQEVNQEMKEETKKGESRLYKNQKLLIGIGIGILVILLLGGMFAIGYFVGRPCGYAKVKAVKGTYSGRGLKGIGRGGLGMKGPGGLGKIGRGWLGDIGNYYDEIQSEIAGKLGLSVEDLQKDMESGKTLAKIAEEKGVSTEDLSKSVATKINEIADKLAAENKITEDQAEKIKANSEDMASKVIEWGRGWKGMRGGWTGF